MWVRSDHHILVLPKTLTYFRMGPLLRRGEGPDYHWSLTHYWGDLGGYALTNLPFCRAASSHSPADLASRACVNVKFRLLLLWRNVDWWWLRKACETEYLVTSCKWSSTFMRKNSFKFISRYVSGCQPSSVPLRLKWHFVIHTTDMNSFDNI